MSVLELIRSDYAYFANFRGGSKLRKRLLFVPRMIVNPSLHAVALVRLSNGSPRWMHWFWRNILIWKHSMDMGYRSIIGPGLFLPHPIGIVIGPGVVIGANVRLSMNVAVGPSLGSPECPVIGDGSILLPNSIVLGSLKVGPEAVVSVNSFVDSDVPAGGVAYTERAKISGPPGGGESAASRAVQGKKIGMGRAENAETRAT